MKGLKGCHPHIIYTGGGPNLGQLTLFGKNSVTFPLILDKSVFNGMIRDKSDNNLSLNDITHISQIQFFLLNAYFRLRLCLVNANNTYSKIKHFNRVYY